MSIFDMITFREFSGSIFIIQVILFSSIILVVSSKKTVLAIKKLANDYYGWFCIVLVSDIIGIIVYVYNKLYNYNTFNESLENFFNCDECKIFFVFAYLITLAFLYNFVRTKNKIIILFFLPLLSILKDYNYFISAIIFISLSYFLGYILNNYRKNNQKRKKEEQIKFDPLTVIIVFWLVIYLIPFIIFPLIFKDGGWMMLYLFFIPVSLSFFPYSIIYSDNKSNNIKLLIFGLILPCILNNILISRIISLAFSNSNFPF